MTLTRKPRAANSVTRNSSSVVLPLPDGPITPNTVPACADVTCCIELTSPPLSSRHYTQQQSTPAAGRRDEDVNTRRGSDNLVIEDGGAGQQLFQHETGRQLFAFMAQHLIDQQQPVGRILGIDIAANGDGRNGALYRFRQIAQCLHRRLGRCGNMAAIHGRGWRWRHPARTRQMPPVPPAEPAQRGRRQAGPTTSLPLERTAPLRAMRTPLQDAMRPAPRQTAPPPVPRQPKGQAREREQQRERLRRARRLARAAGLAAAASIGPAPAMCWRSSTPAQQPALPATLPFRPGATPAPAARRSPAPSPSAPATAASSA